MSYTGKAIDLSKYDKYGKNVELTKVEVELGAIQDLESEIREIVPVFKKLETVSDERADAGIKYSKLKDEEKSLISEIEGEYRTIEKKLEKLKSSAKDLGVSIDTKFIEQNLTGLKQGINALKSF